MSSSPEVVRERHKAIQSGLEALEKLESAGTAPADLKRIRAALEALDLEQSELAATCNMAAQALKSPDRDGVKLNGFWVPRDVIADEVEQAARLRRRPKSRGGSRS